MRESLPSRERELKLDLEETFIHSLLSLPSRERELKRHSKSPPDRYQWSLPSRERELKHLGGLVQGKPPTVAPLAGA